MGLPFHVDISLPESIPARFRILYQEIVKYQEQVNNGCVGKELEKIIGFYLGSMPGVVAGVGSFFGDVKQYKLNLKGFNLGFLGIDSYHANTHKKLFIGNGLNITSYLK